MKTDVPIFQCCLNHAFRFTSVVSNTHDLTAVESHKWASPLASLTDAIRNVFAVPPSVTPTETKKEDVLKENISKNAKHSGVSQTQTATFGRRCLNLPTNKLSVRSVESERTFIYSTSTRDQSSYWRVTFNRHSHMTTWFLWRGEGGVRECVMSMWGIWMKTTTTTKQTKHYNAYLEYIKTLYSTGLHAWTHYSFLNVHFFVCVFWPWRSTVHAFSVLRDVIILAEESCSSFDIPSVNPEMLEGKNIQSSTSCFSVCQNVLRTPLSTYLRSTTVLSPLSQTVFLLCILVHT